MRRLIFLTLAGSLIFTPVASAQSGPPAPPSVLLGSAALAALIAAMLVASKHGNAQPVSP